MILRLHMSHGKNSLHGILNKQLLGFIDGVLTIADRIGRRLLTISLDFGLPVAAFSEEPFTHVLYGVSLVEQDFSRGNCRAECSLSNRC